MHKRSLLPYASRARIALETLGGRPWPSRERQFLEGIGLSDYIFENTFSEKQTMHQTQKHFLQNRINNAFDRICNLLDQAVRLNHPKLVNRLYDLLNKMFLVEADFRRKADIQ